MVKMKTLSVISFFLFVYTVIIAQSSDTEAISNALKTGNTKELVRFFYTNVELKVLSKEDLYSKAQAEIIINDFFTKNPPKNYTTIHNGISRSGAKYTIGQLKTTNGNFRTYYFIKKSGDIFTIHGLRLEKEE